MGEYDTGKKGTASAANAGMEKNSQVTSQAKGAKSGTGKGRQGSRSTSSARGKF